MIKSRILSVFFLISLLPAVAFAQAIRFNLLGLNSAHSTEGARVLFAGIGYEQNVFDKLAVSLEYNFGYTFSIQSDEYYDESINHLSSEEYSYMYSLEVPWSEIAYQSKYFFRDNTENSWYMGMGIGIKWFEYQFEILEELPGYSVTGPGPLQIKKYYQTVSAIPITFRSGFRNSIQSFFQDYNFAVGYLVGKGELKTGESRIDNYLYEKPKLNSIFMSVTCSIGIGWDK